MAAIFRPDVILSTLFSTLLNSCFNHHLKVFTVVCCLAILINATPHFLDTESQLSDEDMMATPDKRPARLSYFQPSQGSSRRRPSRYYRTSHRSPYRQSSHRQSHSYGGSSYGRYGTATRVGGRGGGGRSSRFLYQGFGGYGKKNEWWRKKSFNNRHAMPWDRLPNTNCLRESCGSDADCCRRFSLCHKSVKVCIDCWYGYPCVQDKDCCARYPYCNKVLRTCTQ